MSVRLRSVQRLDRKVRSFVAQRVADEENQVAGAEKARAVDDVGVAGEDWLAELRNLVPVVLQVGVLVERDVAGNRGNPCPNGGATLTAETGTVRIAYRWESPLGEVLQEGSNVLLPHDLRPGESVRAAALCFAPERPGAARLFIGLAQDGEWFPNPLGPIEINIRRLTLRN